MINAPPIEWQMPHPLSDIDAPPLGHKCPAQWAIDAPPIGGDGCPTHWATNAPFPCPSYVWWTLMCRLVLVLLHLTQLLRNGLSYERPTHIKRCPNGCSLQTIVNHPKVIGSSNLHFFIFVQLKFVGKIKNASNFRINGICNDQRWSFDRAYWDLSSGV